jgi:hypothetical protein
MLVRFVFTYAMGASSARYITTSDEISFVDKITYS